jgi:putative nucleotidyltransferase with HDIG domain
MQTLTMTLDLAVDGTGVHQLRTAIICRYIAEELEIRSPELQILLASAMLHDIGAASSQEERERIANPELETLLAENIYNHAEEGYQLLHDSPVFYGCATAIRHHHDHWDGNNPSGLAGDQIPLHSRIILVADRVEIRISELRPILGKSSVVREYIQEEAGRIFDPDVVDAFITCSEKECFWLDLVNPDHANAFHREMDWGRTRFHADDLLAMARLFSILIDRTSRFTATHSRSVSEVAVILASHFGFCEDELYLMRIAGLLHDLGKLSVPNAILEKPGPLDPSERLLVRQHTYYTYRILQKMKEFNQLARWAAWHHETLDGNGYPFHIPESALTLGSRIMAVADIFVALAENRPYRKKLDFDRLSSIMRGMVNNHKITGLIVESLLASYPEANQVILESEELAKDGCHLYYPSISSSVHTPA